MSIIKSLFVGNISWQATSEDLKKKFEEFGTVETARIIMDRDSGRSKGFGFVEVADDDAQGMIDNLNGKDFQGRALVVNVARPRENRGERRF